MTKVNIYYGGRGLIEDPSIHVMNKITEVLNELNVVVQRYNLYEDKKGISVLPKTLKDADAIILVASVEWFGIGGLLGQFLDACWLYGDPGTIHSLHMMPVVLSTTYGERDAYMHLSKAWDILGGLPCDGVSAYVEEHTEFENNKQYMTYIEKRVENFYRVFTGKLVTLPSSDNIVQGTVSRPSSIDLTPQESEQLSMYVSNEKYVQKQKEDIQELSEIFRNLLGDDAPANPGSPDSYIDSFSKHFHGIADVVLTYNIEIMDQKRILTLHCDGDKLTCAYNKKDHSPNVIIKLNHTLLDQIIDGERTMQEAFMTGDLIAKGDMKIMRNFDNIFKF